jgi:hypothetical protein
MGRSSAAAPEIGRAAVKALREAPAEPRMTGEKALCPDLAARPPATHDRDALLDDLRRWSSALERC